MYTTTNHTQKTITYRDVACVVFHHKSVRGRAKMRVVSVQLAGRIEELFVHLQASLCAMHRLAGVVQH